eukprot:15439133-Alexandrium_andersonii.AAC.1
MKIRAPEPPREARCASGARLCKAGLRCLRSPSHEEGCFARRAGRDRDLPGRVWGETSSFDRRVLQPCGCSDPSESSAASRTG